jgi:hypothetical protein
VALQKNETQCFNLLGNAHISYFGDFTFIARPGDLTEFSDGFTQYFQESSGILPQIATRRLLSTFPVIN